MFTTWLRSSRYASAVLMLLRVYLGWTFLHAGWGKLTDAKSFSAAGFLIHSLQHPVLGPDNHPAYPWYNAFLHAFAIPHADVFNFLIPWGEVLVGVGLIFGVLTTAAAFFAMLMNFMYMFAGSISTNPMDILIGMFIIVGGSNSGFFGGDYWLVPYLRKFTGLVQAGQANRIETASSPRL
ncbi:hypothetical protein AAC03nite_04180 [Alicyclobacillus acidoterrestris]|uniref:DoxX family protein n=1 Tax=Alicyclobacillus suci TaxID=2816080 RepID=UPI001195127F|nr:DoxX family protein [Alicyclobacillus suci]GEO24633.1 hypothetical protein AAC03nite_04180 [Alicyclobacillus acidoterrestris]